MDGRESQPLEPATVPESVIAVSVALDPPMDLWLAAALAGTDPIDDIAQAAMENALRDHPAR